MFLVNSENAHLHYAAVPQCTVWIHCSLKRKRSRGSLMNDNDKCSIISSHHLHHKLHQLNDLFCLIWIYDKYGILQTKWTLCPLFVTPPSRKMSLTFACTKYGSSLFSRYAILKYRYTLNVNKTICIWYKTQGSLKRVVDCKTFKRK